MRKKIVIICYIFFNHNYRTNNPPKNLLFSFTQEKDLINEFINMLIHIAPTMDNEVMVWLNLLGMKNKINEIIKFFNVFKELFTFLNQQNEEEIHKEIEVLYNDLIKNENFNNFIKYKNISEIFINKVLQKIIIAKKIAVSQYEYEALNKINYKLDDINKRSYFYSKKIFIVYIILMDDWNKNKNLDHYKGAYIKDYREYNFLKNNEIHQQTVQIDKKKYMKIVKKIEDIQEEINNIKFSFLDIKINVKNRENVNEEILKSLFQPLNAIINVNEIVLKINQIFNKNNHLIEYLEFKSHRNNPIESIIHFPEFLDVVLNFPYSKFLLINQDTYYKLYLIFQVETEKKISQSINPGKYFMDYISKKMKLFKVKIFLYR